MPSSDYKNSPEYESPVKTAMRDNFSLPSQADTFKRRAAENYNYLAGVKPFRQTSEEKAASEKHHERNLKNLQRSSPKLAADFAKGKKSAIIKFAGNLLKKIDWSTDWLFILLGSFGLLKDLFDIAFAALGALPVIGIAGVAIGVIVSFVGNLMFLILTVTVLVLVGSSFKNRGLAKYYIGTAMEFIAEALPGISWLPWTPVYVLVLYLFVLYDRAYQDQGEQAAGMNIPASGVADSYYENKRLAA